MADELLDLVNEDDEVIGTIWRQEANNNPKVIHREVMVIVYDKNKKILFQKRALSKKVGPGMWTVSAAGHVPSGELPENTAHNELQEELGFDTELNFYKKILDKETNETRFIYIYFGKFKDNTKIMLQEREVMDARFFSESDLKTFSEIENVGSLSLNEAQGFWQKSSKV